MQIQPPTKATAFLRQTCPICGHYPILVTYTYLTEQVWEILQECVNTDCDHTKTNVVDNSVDSPNAIMSKVVLTWPGKPDPTPIPLNLSRPKIFFTEPTAKPVDYRSLLQKYMAHIAYLHSTYFVGFCTVKKRGVAHVGVPFTQAELTALLNLTEL